MRKILVISKEAPYYHQSLKEALDMVLIFAAIDQQVSWLIENDAVLALTPSQSPKQLGHKDFTKAIKMLELYDVDQVYVCTDALTMHGLQSEELLIDVHKATSIQKQELISQADYVVVI
ncbi:sulfurtransferase complex subunit TusC [Pseudoalteromonas sp. SSDWG2]|uniref:sulfurtransferase complex subunit TusC n=1 Tax=Pseudoalteromonas sp. SSDWG2 TaxID=3139391 RepID=UPI003BAAF3A5